MNVNALVEIDYTNWRGERRVRTIRPIRALFATSVHHPEPQWLWLATCLESMEDRLFAQAGMHSWTPVR